MKLKQKIITILSTTILLGGYLLPTGKLAVAAAVENLNSQNSQTQNSNVEFNTHLDNSTHEQEYNISNGGKMFVVVNVKQNGYLKNGIVEFSECNYKLNNEQINSQYVQKVENNTIYLKQINAEENVVLELPISFLKEEYIDQQIFDKISSAKLKGTYVNSQGTEIAIEKEVKNQIKWQAEPETQINGEITKYIPYNLNGKYGVLIQAKVTSALKDNVLPIEKTSLEVTVPTINDKKPQSIKVIANKTTATNGEETGIKFTTENYEYDEQTNKVKINVENQINDQGKVAWKNGQDEYLVNFIYKGEDVYNFAKTELAEAEKTKVTAEEIQKGQINANAIKMQMQVSGSLSTYGTEQKELLAQASVEDSIQETRGKITDFTVETVKSLSKGYIYANYVKTEEQLKEEPDITKFEISYKAQISNHEDINEIKFKTSEEKFVEDTKETPVEANIITSSIKINKDVFSQILGGSGKIEILGNTNESIGEITSSTQTDEQGNYVLNLEKEINAVTIKTTQPVAEGNLEIKEEKSFKAKQSIEEEEMKKITKLKLSATLEADTNNETKALEIELQEPVCKAEISIEESKKNLSTVAKNENVIIKVVLDTSDAKNALYKNPELQIGMPSQVSDVEIKDVKILLDDELKLKSKFVTDNQGFKMIRIQLEGTQTKYENYADVEENNVIAKGANIIVTADITLNKQETSGTDELCLFYTNENTKNYNETVSGNEKFGVAKTNINITAPVGVITTNSVSGYDTEESKLLNADQEVLTATVKTKGEEKTVKFESTVANNNEDTINNVYILGRLPFEGNKKIDTNESLGSNFTMKMKNAIKTSGIDENNIKVYYSTEENATKDSLTSSSTTWKEDPKDYSNIKSYLIAIEGEFKHGDQITFNYEAEIPANLIYNKSAYTYYKVYYKNQVEETKDSGIIGLITGNGPDVEVKLSSEVKENESVKEGQKVNFFAEIKNTGGENLTNVTLNIPVPLEATYVTYNIEDYEFIKSEETEISMPVGTIKPGETKKVEYTLEMKDNYQGAISNIVNVTIDNFKNPVESNEYIVNLIDGKIALECIAIRDYTVPVYKGDQIRGMITINSLDEIQENVTITMDIPEGIKVKEAIYENYNGEEEDCVKIENNQIVVNLEKMEEYTKGTISFILEIGDFKGKYELFATAKIGGTPEQISNKLIYNVYMQEFEITQSSSTKYLKEREEITYEFTIKNVGDAEVAGVTFKNELPQGLTFEKMEYTYNGEKTVIDTAVNNSPLIYWGRYGKGATVVAKITAKANILNDNTKDLEVTNLGSIVAQEAEPQYSNGVTTIIQRNADLYQSIPGVDNQITDQRPQYTISGIAWLDANKNGERENTEETLSGIEVILLKKQNGEIVKNIEEGKEKTTRTNGEGKYQFENLTGGEYIVVFCYDAAGYNVTDYQKENVNSSYNSDAVSMLVTLNGKQTYAGVTNTIKITNKDIQNIDIGLYESQKFDLKLDKYITKITVNTPSAGVKTYNVNKSQLEKVETKAREVGKSNIIIEYTIVVTNEGKLAGYARKLVDYLPKNVRFNTELNEDWYSTDDNNTIYNASLQNTLLKPGESKEVKLVLSAQITNNNIGTIINNNAEIYESYNEYGEHDMDSVEGNKGEGEDDMSKADIILSTATGTIVLYVTLAIAVILIISIGIILIKRKFEKI